MQLFRRIIALVGRFETPSSDWGRLCPRIFLRRSLFVGSLNDSAAPGRKSRDNSKRTRIPYSSASFVRIASPIQMYTYYLITRTRQIHEIQHLQYASQFCLKLLEAVTQQAQIACLQQLAGTVQHLLGGCILFSEQVQFGQPEVNLDMQVRCCYERSLCTCLFKQEDSSLQIAPSLS